MRVNVVPKATALSAKESTQKNARKRFKISTSVISFFYSKSFRGEDLLFVYIVHHKKKIVKILLLK